MADDTKQKLDDVLASQYDDDEFKINKREYVGTAVTYEERYGNYTYVIYKYTVDITNPDGVTEPVEYYNYAKFDNGIMNADGTCTYEELCSVSYHTSKFPVGQYVANVYGFETIEDLKEEIDEWGSEWENYTYNF